MELAKIKKSCPRVVPSFHQLLPKAASNQISGLEKLRIRVSELIRELDSSIHMKHSPIIRKLQQLTSALGSRAASISRVSEVISELKCLMNSDTVDFDLYEFITKVLDVAKTMMHYLKIRNGHAQVRHKRQSSLYFYQNPATLNINFETISDLSDQIGAQLCHSNESLDLVQPSYSTSTEGRLHSDENLPIFCKP